MLLSWSGVRVSRLGTLAVWWMGGRVLRCLLLTNGAEEGCEVGCAGGRLLHTAWASRVAARRLGLWTLLHGAKELLESWAVQRSD